MANLYDCCANLLFPHSLAYEWVRKGCCPSEEQAHQSTADAARRATRAVFTLAGWGAGLVATVASSPAFYGHLVATQQDIQKHDIDGGSLGPDMSPAGAGLFLAFFNAWAPAYGAVAAGVASDCLVGCGKAVGASCLSGARWVKEATASGCGKAAALAKSCFGCCKTKPAAPAAGSKV